MRKIKDTATKEITGLMIKRILEIDLKFARKIVSEASKGQYELYKFAMNHSYIEVMEKTNEIKYIKNNRFYQKYLKNQRKILADYMGVRPGEIERAFTMFGELAIQERITVAADEMSCWVEENLLAICDKYHIPCMHIKDKMKNAHPSIVKRNFENLCTGLIYETYDVYEENGLGLSMDAIMAEARMRNPEAFFTGLVASVYFELLADSLGEALREHYKNFSFDRSVEIDREERLKAENERLKNEMDKCNQKMKECQDVCFKEKRKNDEGACQQKEYMKQIELLTKQLEDKKKLIEEQRQMLSDREKYVSWLETESETEPRAEAAEGRQACGKKIVFVGGTPEVVAKLKSVFYKSVFVNSETADIPQKIDGIAMFPKSMSRSLFFKYMDLAREKNLAVVYCKGTNTGVIFNEIKKAMRRE